MSKNADYRINWSQQRIGYNFYEGWQSDGNPKNVFFRYDLNMNQQKWLKKKGQRKPIKILPFVQVL